jgi:hypothetical protein
MAAELIFQCSLFIHVISMLKVQSICGTVCIMPVLLSDLQSLVAVDKMFCN